MKNKIHKRLIFSKIFFTLLFGLSTMTSFGQPDPPPTEVPLDGSIFVFILIAIVTSFVYIMKRKKQFS